MGSKRIRIHPTFPCVMQILFITFRGVPSPRGPTPRPQAICDVAGFRPGRRACCLAHPTGCYICCEGKRTQQRTRSPRRTMQLDAPPASSDWTDATKRKASQLAALRQSPPIDKNVRPEGRAAGVGHVAGTMSGLANGGRDEASPLHWLPPYNKVRI